MTVTRSPKITVLFHCYYQELLEEYLLYLARLNYPFQFLINLTEGVTDNVSEKVKSKYPHAQIFTSTNKGRDIGGYLSLIPHVNKDAEYLLFLHTKKSPQLRGFGTQWRRALLKGVLERPAEVLNALESDDSLGAIASTKVIKNRGAQFFYSLSEKQIRDYCARFDLPIGQFVGGTIFFARAKPYLEFFEKYDPKSLREELEEGNVSEIPNGSKVHAFERILGFILAGKNLKIEGLKNEPLVFGDLKNRRNNRRSFSL